MKEGGDWEERRDGKKDERGSRNGVKERKRERGVRTLTSTDKDTSTCGQIVQREDSAKHALGQSAK